MSEIDWSDQIKVGYVMARGGASTAYVAESTGRGFDKHTDAPVAVRWDGATWVEVAP